MSDLRCLMVRHDEGRCTQQVERIPVDQFPDGTVTIKVEFSSLNYKDALSATGHPGITKSYPHVPGIDAFGTVLDSKAPSIVAGQQVIVTSYGLGVERWGGWCEQIRVPVEWIVPLPDGLVLRDAAILGTAGFTAAQSVFALLHAGIRPDQGEVVVTGATGGVGSTAVMLLSKLGYDVVAVTGKHDQADWLIDLGASRIEGRELLADSTSRPMLSARWSAAIDTVGGAPLATIVRSTKYRGCVTTCGMAAGSDLPLTVFPFILRGVALIGIDSAQCPMSRRQEIWNLLATDWKIEGLDRIATQCSLEDLAEYVPRILAGQIAGRTIVKVYND